MKEKERMDELIAARTKAAKPGHRVVYQSFNLDEVLENEDLFKFPSLYSSEDDGEIPDFMEPPVESPHLSARQLSELRKKYERYLERKREDIIADGPVVASDCEDLICNSCKITIEEIGKIYR